MKIFTLFSILFFQSFSFSVFSKILVVSDIDDTIRKTNTLNFYESVNSIKKNDVAFSELKQIYSQMDFHYSKDASKDVDFYYVSAAPACVTSYQRWLELEQFPMGKLFQRPCDGSLLVRGNTERFKFKIITNILNNAGRIDQVFLFGDNSSYDASIYKKIKAEWKKTPIQIFIRDIRVEATYMDKNLPIKKLGSVNYFLTEKDLLKYSAFDFLSNEQRKKIVLDFKNAKLFPNYLYENLAKRYEKILGYSKQTAAFMAKLALLNTTNEKY